MQVLKYNVAVALIYLILITEQHHVRIQKDKIDMLQWQSSGKGVHMYKGVNLSLLILSPFLKYPMKVK